jgi:phosphate-selective porin OprO and OprP
MRQLSRLAPATLALLLGALPAAAAAQSTDASSVDVAILDVLRARGIIDDAQYAELVALAREKTAAAASEIDLIEGRLARLRAPELGTTGGTPGKLQFKSSDGRWSLGIKGRIQARAETIDSSDEAEDGTNFSVARARLGFEGTAGAENVTYKFEFDAPTQGTLSGTSSTKNFSLRDTWINWGFESGLGLRFGQYKVPFSREELISSGAQEFVDRSIANTQFAPSYEPGAMLHGTLEQGTWEYYAGVSNGQGPGASNPAGEEDNGLRKAVRVVWNPLGAFKLDGPAFQTLDDGSTKLALGVAWNRNDDSSGKTTVTPGSDTDTLGLEGQLMSGPWSVLADFYDRSSDLPGGTNEDDEGFTVTTGWFLVPHVWELVARVSAIDFEEDDDRNETSVGVNYYVDKHNGKWQLDLSELDNDGATADQTRLRVQYQLIF